MGNGGDLGMTVQKVWRPAMYGGFAGIAAVAFLMMANMTSPHPVFCAIQFATILCCGIGVGMIVACGPIRTTKWALNANSGGRKGVITRLALFAIVVSLFAAPWAAAWMPNLRLEIFMFAWIDALLMLFAIGPQENDMPARCWRLAVVEVLAAAYGPFFVAAVNTRLFDGSNSWLCVEYWKYVLIAPGGVLVGFASTAIWNPQRFGLSPIAMYGFCGLFSVMLLATAAYFTVKKPRTRWILLPVVCVFCARGAVVLDAVMRW
jgi:hypothetical protein